MVGQISDPGDGGDDVYMTIFQPEWVRSNIDEVLGVQSMQIPDGNPLQVECNELKS